MFLSHMGLIYLFSLRVIKAQNVLTLLLSFLFLWCWQSQTQIIFSILCIFRPRDSVWLLRCNFPGFTK